MPFKIYTVTDTTKNNQFAGQLMIDASNGSIRQIAAGPGVDKSKIEAAYNDHAKNGATGAQPTQASAANGGENSGIKAADVKVGFDEVSNTMTLADGRSLRFIDKNNAEVTIPGGVTGSQTYHLHYHGASGTKFAQGLLKNDKGYVGGGISGRGVAISMQSMGHGGVMYDTADGISDATMGSIIPRVKPIIEAVLAAAQEAKNQNHPEFADSQLVKNLSANRFR